MKSLYSVFRILAWLLLSFTAETEMRIGIAAYRDVVANRVDFAETLRIYDIQDGRQLMKKELKLPKLSPLFKANAILSSGVEVLICGAINCFFYRILAGNGIQVFPWITGDMDSVLKRFMEGALEPSLPIPAGFGMGPPPFRRRGRFGCGWQFHRDRNF